MMFARRFFTIGILIAALVCMSAAGNAGATAAGNVAASIALLHAQFNDPSGVAVWLEPLKEQPQKKQNERTPAIKQVNKQFVPHVVVISIGQQIDFPNNDPFPHNIFSNSEIKRFDLGIYQEGESRSVRFTLPGVVAVHCNIHPQMEAFVVAVNTPYYAVSNKRGEVLIKDVAPGSYRLKVWHERATAETLKALTRQIEVGSSGAVLGAIQIDEKNYVETPHKNKHGKEYGRSTS